MAETNHDADIRRGLFPGWDELADELSALQCTDDDRWNKALNGGAKEFADLVDPAFRRDWERNGGAGNPDGIRASMAGRLLVVAQYDRESGIVGAITLSQIEIPGFIGALWQAMWGKDIAKKMAAAMSDGIAEDEELQAFSREMHNKLTEKLPSLIGEAIKRAAVGVA